MSQKKGIFHVLLTCDPKKRSPRSRARRRVSWPALQRSEKVRCFFAIDDGWERPGRLLTPWEAELLMLANLCKFNPYGSKHCLRRYLTLQIIPQSHFLRRYDWIHREWWLMDLMVNYIQYFMNMYNMYGNHYRIHINNLYNNPLIVIIIIIFIFNFMNMYNMSVV